ncbi:uncharacterized protein G2W53_014121 [Senna tora]|uniref:Uncharacterized protein n=1 Tax=Senna tora TaxID=362788 RepID=A0A834WSW9_9FABA|nr:uncharacterized protein G2W53_014121 [Senna tora]
MGGGAPSIGLQAKSNGEGRRGFAGGRRRRQPAVGECTEREGEERERAER